jgi:hypothetical protein
LAGNIDQSEILPSALIAGQSALHIIVEIRKVAFAKMQRTGENFQALDRNEKFSIEGSGDRAATLDHALASISCCSL